MYRHAETGACRSECRPASAGRDDQPFRAFGSGSHQGAHDQEAGIRRHFRRHPRGASLQSPIFLQGGRMKYALSSGIILRREWFGCLVFQSLNGRYWQFNADAYEILSCLTVPISIQDLRGKLYLDGLEIEVSDLASFIKHYEEQGVVSQRDEASGILSFFGNSSDFQTNCLIAPSSVTLYITDFCPKNCRHCATGSHNRIDMNAEFKVPDWEPVLQDLRQSGVCMLVISGGEPLASAVTMPVLQMADKMQFGLTLLTDFDDITESQIAGLKSLQRLVNIQTSLDGGSPDTHDFLRGPGSFQKTLRRLRLFQEAGLTFTVSTSVHQKNLDELNRISELAYANGASFVYFNAVAPYGRAKKTMKDLLLDESGLKKLAQICLRLTESGQIKTKNPFWDEELSHLGDDEFDPLSQTLEAMSLGVYNFTISAKGECYLDSKQRAEGLLNLGNIKTNSLLAMWNDPRLVKVRSLFSPKGYALAHQKEVEAALASG